MEELSEKKNMAGGGSKLDYIEFRTLRVNPKVEINTRLAGVSRESSTSSFILRTNKTVVMKQPLLTKIIVKKIDKSAIINA